MDSKPRYFNGDEIIQIDLFGSFNLGLVQESYENNNKCIKIVWLPTGIEETLERKKVRLVKRNLTPGNLVRRTDELSVQMGLCRQVHLNADLLVLDKNEVITDVNISYLPLLTSFKHGDGVALGSWLGAVISVESQLHLSLNNCPEKCVISEKKANILKTEEVQWTGRDYYPGQVLTASIHDMQLADWVQPPPQIFLQESEKFSLVVERLETESVRVDWQQCCAHKEEPPPAELLEGESLQRLRRLNMQDTVQIGQRFSYAPQPFATTIPIKQLIFQLIYDEKVSNGDQKTADVAIKCQCGEGDVLQCGTSPVTVDVDPTLRMDQSSDLIVVKTLLTTSCVDIVWQDGTEEIGIPSIEFLPIDMHDVGEIFFPGDFVITKYADTVDIDNGTYGVVQCVDLNRLVARVAWFYADSSQLIETNQPMQMDQVEVSIYDIERHPDFYFRPGMLAYRVAVVDGSGPSSIFGEVLYCCPLGRVHMRWVDGNLSACWPQNLHKINALAAPSQAMKSSQPISKREEEEEDCQLVGHASSSTPIPAKSFDGENEDCHVSDALKTIGSIENDVDSEGDDSDYGEDEEEEGDYDDDDEDEDLTDDDNFDFEGSFCYEDTKPIAGNLECFEVLSELPANHYFKLPVPSAPRPEFLSVVRNEMKSLANSLPAGVWVKCFESRMDLFSIMIRGPDDTPYADGLFLFDAKLPPDYPWSPPKLHYKSYYKCARRLNPNLYQEGKVCLSLLNTWPGEGSEKWAPTSTLLQVIVSIQGLILVSDPYFNEPSYAKSKGLLVGDESSREYNEGLVVDLVRSMASLARFPHESFVNEIKQHFVQNSLRLIQRMEKWLSISEKFHKTVPNSDFQPRKLMRQPWLKSLKKSGKVKSSLTKSLSESVSTPSTSAGSAGDLADKSLTSVSDKEIALNHSQFMFKMNLVKSKFKSIDYHDSGAILKPQNTDAQGSVELCLEEFCDDQDGSESYKIWRKQWQESEINKESEADQPSFSLLPLHPNACLALKLSLDSFRSVTAGIRPAAEDDMTM